MIDFKPLIERIKSAQEKWSTLAAVPDNLSSQIPGLTKNEITSFLIRCRIQLENALESEQHLNPIYFQQISTHTTNLEAYVNQHIPSNPTAHIPGLLNVLYALSTSIEQAVTPTDKESGFSNISNKLKDKLSDSIAKASVVHQLLENTEKLISTNKIASDELTKATQLSQEAITKIQERDRTTAESTNRINETEKKSLTLFAELEGNLKKLNESGNNIQKHQDELNQLSSTLQNKLNEAQKLLEDANRHGLAGAFKTRKDKLFWPAIGWIGLFLTSIIMLIKFGNSSIENIGTDWHLLLLRLPLTAPLIWLGWFSVRQYGFNKKLQEDYAFKVASAMSFQGYKNEIDADPEMLSLLRKSAIENFSSNPLRIFNDNNNHGSPLHELIENVSDDKFHKILDTIKTLGSRK